MKSRTREFKKDLPGHMANETMRGNIARATWLSVRKRDSMIAEIDWEVMRQSAHDIKREVINNLEAQLQTFVVNAQARGIVVYRAADAAEAVKLAAEIAQRHQVKRIVKSKSMVTEEIGFNRHMEACGLEVVETDLGEYIIQLNGDPPSHLTGPAVHLSRKEIAAVFTRYLGIPYNEDPEVLTRAARAKLRNAFLEADMGVTGANFAIVESGGITVVENEGNARLSASITPVHVAFIGMERLIPKLSDLQLFLPLLCRSSTGQRLTSFISTYGGPRGGDVYDGPGHVYYIILDNGRSRLLADERLREALYCIRCGACYNSCPVYQNIGGHAYGWVYQGPIGAVITPELLGLEAAAALPFASSLCGNCSEVCPVKIPLHELLLYQRKRVVDAGLQPRSERAGVAFFAVLARNSRRFALAGKIGRKVQRLLGRLARIPGWSRSRELPVPPETTFRDWWAGTGSAPDNSDRGAE